jgi:hypothetical protein
MQRKTLRTNVACALVAFMVACGGGGGNGGPTGVPVDDIQGSYTVSHTVVVEGLGTFTCPGAMMITQNGNSFSGSISITGMNECTQLASQGTLNGTVSSSGVLAFAVSLPLIEGIVAACEILSGTTIFTGTATTTGVTGTRTNRIRCPVEDTTIEVDFTYTITGSKI